MLTDIDSARRQIESGKSLFIAGDESLLARLPKGSWIGGTIPYFMDSMGGVTDKSHVFLTEAPAISTRQEVKWYAEGDLPRIPRDAPENGFSVIIIPATSAAHISYARNAPRYDGLFLKPIIGWISGVHLSDLGKVSPKTFNGKTGESSDSKAVVMHVSLPAGMLAAIGIVNLFRPGRGDALTFPEEGFTVRDCLVGGSRTNFAQYIVSRKIDTRLPLVADYSGTMVNVSIQAVKEKEQTVDLYAPVFKGVEYRFAEPVKDYVREFAAAMPAGSVNPAFSCNCILNFLYSELEGKKTGSIVGPITFGEIAYQLLNQTLTYLEIKG
jgi:hypothetical protein